MIDSQTYRARIGLFELQQNGKIRLMGVGRKGGERAKNGEYASTSAVNDCPSVCFNNKANQRLVTQRGGRDGGKQVPWMGSSKKWDT